MWAIKKEKLCIAVSNERTNELQELTQVEIQTLITGICGQMITIEESGE